MAIFQGFPTGGGTYEYVETRVLKKGESASFTGPGYVSGVGSDSVNAHLRLEEFEGFTKKNTINTSDLLHSVDGLFSFPFEKSCSFRMDSDRESSESAHIVAIIDYYKKV